MRNGFTSTLKGIIAIDDVWGLFVFSICPALVDQSGGWAAPMLGAGRDMGVQFCLVCELASRPPS
ncbi:hypothetical protein [Litoreibacter halocynthiae]|uniref:hypothetical protein n=1 Tax=Litoreibacter halocynthiae TaxID=1242689 RepID=UPI0010625695|nr:hypothetical protein [Litoreibacter halocynthiae]